MTQPTILSGGPWDGLSFRLADASPVITMEMRLQSGGLTTSVYQYAGTVADNGTAIYTYNPKGEDPNRAAALFRGMASGLEEGLEAMINAVHLQHREPREAAQAAAELVIQSIKGTADEMDRRMRAAQEQENPE